MSNPMLALAINLYLWAVIIRAPAWIEWALT
jgi:hypothetical protein